MGTKKIGGFTDSEGLYRSVEAPHFDTLADMTAVSNEDMPETAMVAVGTPPSWHFYDKASTATAGGAVRAADDGVGRFFAVGEGGSPAVANVAKFYGVRAASQAALPAYTRTGNVILADANGALAAQDGVTLAVGDRFLLKDGAAAADNGIYVVDAVGGASAKFQFTRATDYDSSDEVTDGDVVAVAEGTVNADQIFRLTTNEAITLNTTGLTFRRDLIIKVASHAISHDDLTTSSMTETEDFAAALPATAIFMGSYANITEAFSDGMGSTTTFDLGIKSGNTDGFIDGGSLDSIARVGTPRGVELAGTFFGGITPSVIVASDVNVDTLTTGEGIWFVFYIEPGL